MMVTARSDWSLIKLAALPDLKLLTRDSASAQVDSLKQRMHSVKPRPLSEVSSLNYIRPGVSPWVHVICRVQHASDRAAA